MEIAICMKIRFPTIFNYKFHTISIVRIWENICSDNACVNIDREPTRNPIDTSYRKPPTISSGLNIYFRKRFFMGLYKGGLIYGGGGGLYMDDLLC